MSGTEYQAVRWRFENRPNFSVGPVRCTLHSTFLMGSPDGGEPGSDQVRRNVADMRPRPPLLVLSYVTIKLYKNPITQSKTTVVVAQGGVVGAGLSATVATTTATEATSTTATAAATTATTTTVLDVRAPRSLVETLQLRGNLLLSLSHDLAKVTTQVLVLLGEQRQGGTGGTTSTGSTDSVDVVLNVAGHVVVDNVGDTLDI